jgi:hypothetical protein
MAEAKSYQGSCHCGKIRYRVEVDLGGTLVTCNCSICKRTGTVLTFVGANRFTLEQGESALTDYQFNRKVIHHLFCSTCGVRSFARGTGPDGNPMVAVNVRCLEGVDLGSLRTQEYDGASA